MRASRASSTSRGETSRARSRAWSSAMERDVSSMLFDDLRHDEEAIGRAGRIGQRVLGTEARDARHPDERHCTRHWRGRWVRRRRRRLALAFRRNRALDRAGPGIWQFPPRSIAAAPAARYIGHRNQHSWKSGSKVVGKAFKRARPQEAISLLLQEIERAMANAAAAASPPMRQVWRALRRTGTPVKWPLIPPKSKRARRVTATESQSALCTSERMR